MIDISSRGRRAAFACAIALSAILMLTSTASAEIETQAQTTARANVEAIAAKLGVASNEAQALKDQKMLMPAVKEAVAAGAGKTLLEHTTNPSVAADLARGYAKRKVTRSALTKRTKPRRLPNGTGGPAQPGNVEAKAASCTTRQSARRRLLGRRMDNPRMGNMGRNDRLDLRKRRDKPAWERRGRFSTSKE